MTKSNIDRSSLIIPDNVCPKDHFAIRAFEGVRNLISLETMVNGERQDVQVTMLQILEVASFIKKYKRLCKH